MRGTQVDPDATREAPAASAQTEHIGPYRLVRRVGEGGMGEVWLADQAQPIRRQVAVKIIKAGMDSAGVIARFDAERQALALMDHGAIARVFDAGTTPQGRPYFAMEYVRGESITEYAVRHGLSIRARLELFVQVCEGVHHAHQKGIIHRDLKPSNILVTLQDDRPVPKIIDFGVAKAMTRSLTERTLHTEFGALIGTPEYMSPEQVEMSGADVDTRTDVYALGVVLYELLTETLPFDSKALREKSVPDLQKTIREVDPPRPSTRLTKAHRRTAAGQPDTAVTVRPSELRGDLDWITMKALEKDRARRYGSVSDLAADIRRHFSNLPVLAGPPTTAYRVRKFVRRHRGGVMVAGVALVSLVAVTVTTTIQAGRIARERDRANREAAAATQVSDFLVNLFRVPDPGEARGNSLTAREILDKGAKDIEQRGGMDPAVRAQMTATIGGTYQSLGLYAAAEAQLERALETRRRALGNEAPETLRSLAALGHVLVLRQQYDRALALYREATDTGRRVLAPDHPLYLAAMQDLGYVLHAKGQHDEALRVVGDTLARERRVLGDDHPQTVTGLGRWAEVLYGAGRHDEAEAAWREQWERLKRLRGSDDPDTLGAERQLASSLVESGRLDEGEPLHREVVQIYRRILGPDHPRTAAAENTLGLTVQRRPDGVAEAEDLFKHAIAISTKTLGPEADSTLLFTNNLGVLYLNTRRDADAEQIFAANLAISRRVRGMTHQRTLMVMNNLALVYGRLHRLRDATALQTETIETARRTLPAGHPFITVFTITMAEIYALNGQSDSALQWLDDAVAHGRPNPDEIAADDDLKALRQDQRFQAIVERMRGQKR